MSDNLTLLSLVKVPMSGRQLMAIERIDAEDFSGVIRLATKELAKQGVQVTALHCRRAILALKQYYALTVFDPLNMHAVSEALDPFWHAHVLDTVRYQMLGQDIGGFMHHDPLDAHDEAKLRAVNEVYHYTYDVLSRIFGEENLDQEFHPSQLPMSSTVCLHDVEIQTEKPLEDIMPLVPVFAPSKARYGYAAQKRAVSQTLDIRSRANAA